MRKRKKVLSILIISMIIILIGITFAFVEQRIAGEKRQVITAGNLELELLEDENNLQIENALPVYDEVGMISTPFSFQILNKGKKTTGYIINLVDITDSNVEKLDTNIVKYGLTKNEKTTIDFLSNLENGAIDVGVITQNETIEYQLRLWIDQNVEEESLIKNKTLSYRIDLELTETLSPTLEVDEGVELASQIYIINGIYKNVFTPKRAGYKFLGWYNEFDTLITEGAKVEEGSNKLVAKWEKTTIIVTFDANGGTVNPSSKEVEIGGSYQILPTPIKNNYEFLGWYTEKINGTKIDTVTKVEGTENQVLYAHYLYKETILNGANPILSSSLVPIKIANDGTVTKANLSEEWYSYNKQNWANAVVLENSTNYSNGQVIPEANIRAYFVWIPRYRYKIFNIGNYSSLTSTTNAAQTIDIVFENKNISTSNGTTLNSWLTHPAFTAFNSNGFWVGKFESGYKGAASNNAAQVNSTDSSKLIIKPNSYVWGNLSIGSMFKISYDFLRNNDSHMMKNTEWGAVAYLQHSIYGSRKSVRINNNSLNITGYASVTEPTCSYNNGVSTSCNLVGTSTAVTQPYNTSTGYLASTTSNISGIYDMSGGAYEYVMGYNANRSTSSDESGITSYYSNFFSSSSWSKYYDQYFNSLSTHMGFNTRKLGDATGEMGPFASFKSPSSIMFNRGSWYGDQAHFMSVTQPWFSRGDCWYSGIESGIFQFSPNTGKAINFVTFRVVLTP